MLFLLSLRLDFGFGAWFVIHQVLGSERTEKGACRGFMLFSLPLKSHLTSGVGGLFIGFMGSCPLDYHSGRVPLYLLHRINRLATAHGHKR